jgi:hypothetical protein
MGPKMIPLCVERAIRWLLAVSLIVIGVDHFIALNSIATRLIPSWIPWRVFWTAFLGIAFIEHCSESARTLGRGVPRSDVRDLGRHAPLASGAETLQLPEFAARQPVVEPVHCNRSVAQLLGSRFPRREPFIEERCGSA